MAKKDEEELLELLEAIPPGTFVFEKIRHGKAVIVRNNSGPCGIVSASEFDKALSGRDQVCTLCSGQLQLTFNREAKPSIYLLCDKCGRAHVCVDGSPYLFDF